MGCDIGFATGRMQVEKKRIPFLDRLRAFCMYGVVLGHLCTWEINALQPGCFEWNVSNLYNGLARVCVPLFLMISGFLALEQPDMEHSRQAGKKGALRFLRDYIFWSACYAAIPLLRGLRNGTPGLPAFLKNVVQGEFHLWYLRMLCGIFVLLPVLFLATREEYTRRLLLGVCFFSTILLPALEGIPGLEWTAEVVQNSYLDTGYLFYFLAGYEMRKNPPRKTQRVVIYGLGAAGAVWSVTATWYLSCLDGCFSDFWLSQRSLSVAATAVAVFAAAQQVSSHREKTGRTAWLAETVSANTMGIYAVHVFFLLMLRKFSVSPYQYSPVWWLPLLALAVFALSFAVTKLLRCTPLRRFV